MEKNKLRTNSQEEYRGNLAELLWYLRKSWNDDLSENLGNKLAENLLEKRKNSQEYINAKEWTDKTILQQLKRSLLLPFYVLKNGLPSLKKMRKREQKKFFQTLVEEQKGKIINDALKNRENWENIIKWATPEENKQKYILVVDPKTKKLKFISENLRNHRYILLQNCPNGLCLWGWQITKNNKSITLYWDSSDYGRLSEREMKYAINLLQRDYPDYTITNL